MRSFCDALGFLRDAMSERKVSKEFFGAFIVSEIISLYTTLDNEKDALVLAHLILKAKLAACIQIESIQSLHNWKGSVQNAQEWRVLCKSTREKEETLVNFVEANHPYEVPAVFTVQVSFASRSYEEWLRSELV